VAAAAESGFWCGCIQTDDICFRRAFVSDALPPSGIKVDIFSITGSLVHAKLFFRQSGLSLHLISTQAAT